MDGGLHHNFLQVVTQNTVIIYLDLIIVWASPAKGLYGL